jgi:broad specificity phosphatase PhoE
MQLYFVRHGESVANVLQVFSNRDLSHGLTDRGRTQVERLAERLAGVPFAAFYSSPVVRAQESAHILSSRLGIDCVTSAALAEYDVGELEGQSDAASWQRYYVLRDAWFRDKDFAARIPGGESFDDIRARFLPFIDGLRSTPPSGPVLLLGHGGTFHCMLPLILSNVSFDHVVEHGMGNADVVIAEQRSDSLVCVEWGRWRTFDDDVLRLPT